LRPPTFFDSFNINIQNQESGDTVSQYLISTDVELSSLAKFPRMERLYRMYNTTLPSSAAVERLFSQGFLVLKSKRERLGDKTFEMQLLLNANKEYTPQ
jgi:hypothetical protein